MGRIDFTSSSRWYIESKPQRQGYNGHLDPKKGYPVVQIKRDGNKMKLTQSWFLLNPSNKMKNRPEFKTYKWYVPFTYTNKQELNFDFETKPIWLTPDTDECIFFCRFYCYKF